MSADYEVEGKMRELQKQNFYAMSSDSRALILALHSHLQLNETNCNSG